jgi:hypothetical protein
MEILKLDSLEEEKKRNKTTRDLRNHNEHAAGE